MTGAVVIPKDYVLHIAGLSYDGLIGYSPIDIARNAIGLAIATENYGAEFFSNSANPGGIIEVPGSVTDPDMLRRAWEALYRGTSKTHGCEYNQQFAPTAFRTWEPVDNCYYYWYFQ